MLEFTVFFKNVLAQLSQKNKKETADCRGFSYLPRQLGGLFISAEKCDFFFPSF